MEKTMQDYINSVYNVGHLTPQKQKLIEAGYKRFITREGCLLDDELWVHPQTLSAHLLDTDNKKYIFVFKEKYVNDWSSTQSMKRYRKLAKTHVEFLEKAGAFDFINN